MWTFALPTRYNGSGKEGSRQGGHRWLSRKAARRKETEKNFARGVEDVRTLLTFAARFERKGILERLVTEPEEKKKNFALVLAG
ncbi:hypothetical protein O71_19740 [Pontibacter sp. BAB1700]|nr:hypothetical protein O71_19740 [Pontibacter sp. BAB1700]